METFDCIEKRRSIRSYLDTPLEWEKICNVLRAAQLAPSAGNSQDCKFVVVTDKTKRTALANASLKQHWIAQAPAIIVVYSEPKITGRYYGLRGEKLYSIQNSSAAAQNILLAATDQGLATCWVGAFDEQMVNNVLGAPDSARPQILIPIGYTDNKPTMPRKNPLTDQVYINGWRSKLVNIDLMFDNFSEAIRKKIDLAKNKLKADGATTTRSIFDKSKEKIIEIQEKLKNKMEDRKNIKEKELSKDMGDEEEVLEDADEEQTI